MKLGLLAVVLLVCGSVAAKAQSCVTSDDVKVMLARLGSQSQAAQVDKKLQSELLKMAAKHRELLLEVVGQDQQKDSTREKLHKLNEIQGARLCEILKTAGWPTTALVDRLGVLAAFHILKNSASFEMQRDLLPVIVAAVKKDPTQKPEFAGLFDRLRVSAGLKQLFGKLSDLNGVYEQVINDLGKVYSLGYKPNNEKRDGSWRNVQISIVNRPDLTTRARPGYYAL